MCEREEKRVNGGAGEERNGHTESILGCPASLHPRPNQLGPRVLSQPRATTPQTSLLFWNPPASHLHPVASLCIVNTSPENPRAIRHLSHPKSAAFGSIMAPIVSQHGPPRSFRIRDRRAEGRKAVFFLQAPTETECLEAFIAAVIREFVLVRS